MTWNSPRHIFGEKWIHILSSRTVYQIVPRTLSAESNPEFLNLQLIPSPLFDHKTASLWVYKLRKQTVYFFLQQPFSMSVTLGEALDIYDYSIYDILTLEGTFMC